MPTYRVHSGTSLDPSVHQHHIYFYMYESSRGRIFLLSLPGTSCTSMCWFCFATFLDLRSRSSIDLDLATVEEGLSIGSERDSGYVTRSFALPHCRDQLAQTQQIPVLTVLSSRTGNSLGSVLQSEEREEREREETKETPCRTHGPRRSSARSTPSRGYCSWCVCSHEL